MKKGQQYRIDGGDWIDVPSDAAIDLTGLSPCTIEVIERGDGVTTIDSDIQQVVVTKAEVPTTPTANDCATLDNNDGKLVGVTSSMQYKEPGAGAWTAGIGQDVEGLAPGTYSVRVKPNGTVLASESQPLTVRAFVSHTVKFKVVNGAWSDGTTDEKSVTLTGHDGDVLKLSESQIPKAGANPSSGHKEGSWDTTPSTETEIGGDAVYTYTYKEFSYSCTDGDGSSWTKGSKDGLPLTFKRSDEDQTHEAFSHFKSVMVDGKEIEDSDYTVSKGDGVVVTLKSSFLSTLGSGEHTLTSIFDDGAAEGKFSVAEPADDKELFTLTFVPNGGQVYDSTAAVQKTYEGGTVITMPEPTRDGYRFLYWEGSQYYAGQEYTVTENHTFTAQWKKEDPKPATHTITFNANGGTGEMPALSAAGGSKAKLTPSTLKRDGYSFSGWNTKADGTGTAYADQAEVEVKGDMVLYAQWKKNTTPKAAVRNTTTTKTLPKTGEADLGAMAALLGAVAAAALLASRAVKE
ncbi:MAG: InlB B-repeat-containing protein [Olsenella sp.]|nr:InlB B-repeat-containing protein [Olsenella sp.]